jgi:excisionase family DNA binding protein
MDTSIFSTHDRQQSEQLPRQGFNAREAARIIGISERTLWGLTKRGQIRCFRVGRSVLYSLDAIRDFIQVQEQKAGQNGNA